MIVCGPAKMNQISRYTIHELIPERRTIHLDMLKEEVAGRVEDARIEERDVGPGLDRKM